MLLMCAARIAFRKDNINLTLNFHFIIIIFFFCQAAFMFSSHILPPGVSRVYYRYEREAAAPAGESAVLRLSKDAMQGFRETCNNKKCHPRRAIPHEESLSGFRPE